MKIFQIVLVTIFMAVMSHMCSAQSIGPSTLNAAGRSATLGGNTYEWSVGEMVLVNTVSTTGLVVTQGTLQPQIQVTGIKDSKLALEGLSIYPNPANDHLNIDLNVARNLDVTIKLSDVSGRTYYVKTRKSHNGSDLITLDLSPYAGGVYLLQIETLDRAKTYYNTFKVVKN